VDEFNRIYAELNSQVGGITQKVPNDVSYMANDDAGLEKSKASKSAIMDLD
jgi:hypothetical protein